MTNVVDIGANPIDGDPPYKRLLENRLCRVIGFEPQTDALQRLNAAKSDLESYFPYTVGDGEAATLNVCRAGGMTSLLTPDQNRLAYFPKFSEWGQIVRKVPVATRRLDDIREIASIDFLKIDAQGSELAVFKSGRTRLKEAVAVHTEVSFVPLYKDQPPYGEIDLEMRALGFVPHAFAAINRRMIYPLAGNDPFQAFNQLLEADVVYVRDFTQPKKMSSEQLKHLAIIAHFCYGSFDLAANCIHHLVRAKAVQENASEQYLAELQTPKPS